MTDKNADFNPNHQGARLTTWVKEPNVTMLINDLEVARGYQSIHLANIIRWNQIRDVKDLPEKKGEKTSRVQKKLVKEQQEWRYPSLTEPFLNTVDMFKLEPVSFEDELASRQNEAVLNHQWQTVISRTAFIDNYIRSAVDDGTVIVKMSWLKEKEPAVEQVPNFLYTPILNPAHAEAIKGELAQLAELQQENVFEFNQHSEEARESLRVFQEEGSVYQVSIEGYTARPYERVLVNKPVLDVMNPANVYIDPACDGDYKRARFIIHTYETTRSNLLKNGRYKNLDSVDWTGNGVYTSGTHHTPTENSISDVDDITRKKIVVHEYWGYYDKDGNGLLKPIVASWIGQTMIRMEDNPYPNRKMPFVVATYQPVKRELYGTSDAEVLENPQKIIGAVTRGMINIVGHTAAAQTGIAEGLLNPENKKRYYAGKDYEFDPNIGTPNGQIIEHTFAPIPPTVLQFMQTVQSEAAALTGINSYSQGLTGDSHGSVAAGINATITSTSKREESILKRMREGIEDIGKFMCMMNQLFMPEEQVVRVTNKGFIKVRRDELQGEFDLRIEVSSNEVDERKVQDLVFLMQTMGPNMDDGTRKKMISEILHLKKMPRFAEEIRAQEPSEDEKLLAQLGIQKAQLEVEKLQSEIGVNTGKAAKSEADRELTDLERLSKVTGLSHAEAKELHGQQGRANLDLEILKALVAPKKEGESTGDVDTAIDYRDLVTDASTTELDTVRGNIQETTDEQAINILRGVVQRKIAEEAREAEIANTPSVLQ